MDKTNFYYKQNYEAFIDNTFTCDMEEQYNFFFKNLSKEAKTILDLGFGSARDMLYFKSRGFEVYGIDVVDEFCRHAQSLGLNNVYNMDVKNMTFTNLFDGIWACASLLHIEEEDLGLAFLKCYEALKDDGIIYASFKYGTFSGLRNGRYFTDMTEDKLLNFIDKDLFVVKDMLITSDVREDRKDEKWLNVILKKSK